MSQVTYKDGLDYLKSYSGVLKFFELILHSTVLILTTIITSNFQSDFFCGISIYGLTSVVVLIIFHVRGFIKKSDFPWFWVEFFNVAIMTILLLVSSSLVAAVLTKGFIIAGIIGYVTLLVYALDSLEKYNIAKTPRARYVWTTPNMPV